MQMRIEQVEHEIADIAPGGHARLEQIQHLRCIVRAPVTRIELDEAARQASGQHLAHETMPPSAAPACPNRCSPEAVKRSSLPSCARSTAVPAPVSR